MVRKETKKEGFTLVELSLSLVFIGVLSVIAVLIINNTIVAYQRGLTLNKINDVGMDLVDDIRTAVQSSPMYLPNECEKEDSGEKEDSDSTCVSFVKKGKVNINGTEENDVPLYGGFCTGKYSYVWRSGYIKNDEGISIKGNRDFRLVKIKDDATGRDGGNVGRSVCINYMNPESYNIDDYEEYEELLADGSGLAIYDMYAPMPAIGENRTAYYSISFILGTVDGGMNIMATGDYCTPPKGPNSNFNYCAINKFNFAAQAGGITSGSN